MKIKILLASILLLVGLSAYSQTNLEATAKAVVQTNLNQVMIEILSGVKDAGGEIYGASKSVIKKSVDFAVEQAPDVVRQFLKWKMAESIITLSVWCAVAIIALYYSFRLMRLWRTNGQWDEEGGFAAGIFGIILRVVGILTIIISCAVQVPDITKIVVAPKVYIIEYVVDLARGNTQQTTK